MLARYISTETRGQFHIDICCTTAVTDGFSVPLCRVRLLFPFFFFRSTFDDPNG